MCASDGSIVPSTSLSLAAAMMSSAQIFDGILVIVFSSSLAGIGANLCSSGTLHFSCGLYGCISLNLVLMLSGGGGVSGVLVRDAGGGGRLGSGVGHGVLSGW